MLRAVHRLLVWCRLRRRDPPVLRVIQGGLGLPRARHLRAV